MNGQVVVSVPAAKRLIALAIYDLPEVRAAREKGKILLKAGTTVAAFAELFGAPPLRIGGRITPDGARTAKALVQAPHYVLIESGQWRGVDECLDDELAAMGPDDIFVTGANALDCRGSAALMAGLAGGGAAGRVLSAVYAEGIRTIIAVGLEKLIPGSVADAVAKAGRGRADRAMGMAVGLMPLAGRVVTEKDALELLTGATVTVIGAGGLGGAEGATVMAVEGTQTQVNTAFALIAAQKERPTAGDAESLVACDAGGYYCDRHRGCIYRRGKSDE